MVGLAAICWAIWRTRKMLVSRRRKSDLLLRSFVWPSFILFWTELQQVENRALLAAGAEALKNTALRLLPQGSMFGGAGGLTIQ